jgi:hypothetical protein
MARPVVNAVACVLSSLAICGVIAVTIASQLGYSASSDEPMAKAAPTDAVPQAIAIQPETEFLGPEKVRLLEPTPSPATSKLPRKFSWEEVEAILDKLRGERAKRAQAQDDLASWYTLLSRPYYTESPGYSQHLAKLEEWRQKMPKSPTPLVVLARTHKAWAWEARGGGLANTVTEDGWKKYAERLREAHSLLEKAIALGVPDGEAYSQLIEIAKGSGASKEQTEALLEAGMKLDPRYMSLYTEMAVALLPRWGGEPGDIVAFAQRMLNRLQGDDALDVYGHIAYAVHTYDQSLLYFGGFDLQSLIKAGDIWLDRYPNARNMPYFAALATMAAGDRDAARRLRPRLTQAIAPRVPSWQTVAPTFFAWCDEDSRPPHLVAHHWLPRYSPFTFTGRPNEIWFSVRSDSQAFALLDLKSGHVNQTLTGPGMGMKYMAYDARRQWLMAGFDKSFQGWALWTINRPDRPRLYPTKTPCHGVAINPKEPQLAWMEGKTLHTAELAQWKEGPTLELPEAPLDILFSADGKRIAALGEGISVWDLSARKKQYDLPSARTMPMPTIGCEELLEFDEQGRVWAIAFVFGTNPPRRDLVHFSADGKTWETIAQDFFAGGTRKPHAAVLAADHSLLAFAEPAEKAQSPEKIRIWDIARGKLRAQLEGHPSQIGMMAFSTDTKQLASITTSGSAIRLWDVPPVSE